MIRFYGLGRRRSVIRCHVYADLCHVGWGHTWHSCVDSTSVQAVARPAATPLMNFRGIILLCSRILM